MLNLSEMEIMSFSLVHICIHTKENYTSVDPKQDDAWPVGLWGRQDHRRRLAAGWLWRLWGVAFACGVEEAEGAEVRTPICKHSLGNIYYIQCI